MKENVKNYTVLQVKNLSWSYGKDKILDDISISIFHGKFISIIGPNGSGKTTLLRSISTWLKPQKGTVFLENKDILTYSSKQLAKHMAFIPQNTHIDFEFTALEIVLMGREVHLGPFQQEGPDDMEIAREAMEYTNTWQLRDRPVNQLSGGERQRVIIARALAQKAEILLMDEPISHLDIFHQIEILNLVKRLQNEKGLTVVAILHDLNLAAQYSDVVAIMDRGRIKSTGAPKEVITKENIQEAYGISVYMTEHPVYGCPYVMPLND